MAFHARRILSVKRWRRDSSQHEFVQWLHEILKALYKRRRRNVLKAQLSAETAIRWNIELSETRNRDRFRAQIESQRAIGSKLKFNPEGEVCSKFELSAEGAMCTQINAKGESRRRNVFKTGIESQTHNVFKARVKRQRRDMLKIRIELLRYYWFKSRVERR